MYKCQTNSDWKSAENYKRIIKYNKVNLMTFILFFILTTSTSGTSDRTEEVQQQ